MSEVLESAFFIFNNSKDVTINFGNIEKISKIFVEKIKKNEFYSNNWKEHELNPKELNENTINWIFIIDTLNFCFWSLNDDKSLFTVSFNGKEYNGYWSLCACINRALKEGIPITNPSYLININKEKAMYIFRSNNNESIPLLEERIQVLQEAGKILLEKFDGSFVNCIKQANHSAKELLNIIINNFNSYKDEAVFEGKIVKFYKRAQILIADIWACFEGQGLGFFYDIDYLTMFADYRVPQILVYYEILNYSDYLMKLLKENILILAKDRLEIEIRGCSIWAVELLKRKMIEELNKEKENFIHLNCIIIDFYLWNTAKSYSHLMKTIPIHKTKTIFY